MREHELKCWPEPFAAILDGRKRYEIRVDDRGFAVGDVLRLREWEPRSEIRDDAGNYGHYTGEETRVRVTYLTPAGGWGLPKNMCVMSIEPLAPPLPEGEPAAGLPDGPFRAAVAFAAGALAGRIEDVESGFEHASAAALAEAKAHHAVIVEALAAAPAPGVVLSEEQRRAIGIARDHMLGDVTDLAEPERWAGILDHLLSRPSPRPATLSVGEREATLKRPHGCSCTWEAGDSRCDVHPTCDYCGDAIDPDGVPPNAEDGGRYCSSTPCRAFAATASAPSSETP